MKRRRLLGLLLACLVPLLVAAHCGFGEPEEDEESSEGESTEEQVMDEQQEEVDEQINR